MKHAKAQVVAETVPLAVDQEDNLKWAQEAGDLYLLLPGSQRILQQESAR